MRSTRSWPRASASPWTPPRPTSPSPAPATSPRRGKTMSHELSIRRVAHIEDAHVRFGDLTVLVGPQATGKSILLQFHKLLVDVGCVLAEMKRYGLAWEKDLGAFL